MKIVADIIEEKVVYQDDKNPGITHNFYRIGFAINRIAHWMYVGYSIHSVRKAREQAEEVVKRINAPEKSINRVNVLMWLSNKQRELRDENCSDSYDKKYIQGMLHFIQIMKAWIKEKDK
jgi:hypothetical protein